MGVEDVVQRTQDALTVRRVFGDPYEKDGITVIPTARLTGGAGGGGAQRMNGTRPRRRPRPGSWLLTRSRR